MKKTLFAAAVLAAGVAFGEYGVSLGDYGYLSFVIDQTGAENPVAFEYARVGVEGQNAYLDMQGTATPWVMQNGSGTATDPNMANLGDFNDPLYSYYVELYDEAFNAVGRSDSAAYGDLKGYISTEMGQGGITSAWTVGAFHSVPEPTGGLLVLIGAGLLALRRRTHVRGGARARSRTARGGVPIGACLAVLLACGAALGAANDTLITFSTAGVDRYADGSAVKDGECYALVWTRNGAQFAGLAADGQPVDAANSVLVLVAPIARDGKCPPTVFEINARFAARLADGSFDVYLLDTRNAAGRVTGVGADGRPERVNGFGWVAKATGGGRGATRPADDVGGSIAAGAAAVTAVSAEPRDVPQPTIKAVKVAGGYAYLTVSGTSPCLQYRAVQVGLGGQSGEIAAGATVDGKAGEDIVIVTPAKGNAAFFKVGRN